MRNIRATVSCLLKVIREVIIETVVQMLLNKYYVTNNVLAGGAIDKHIATYIALAWLFAVSVSQSLAARVGDWIHSVLCSACATLGLSISWQGNCRHFETSNYRASVEINFLNNYNAN